MDSVTKDHAFLYETTTNDGVQGAPIATPHSHDGTTGAILRTPIAQCYVGAILPGRGTTTSGPSPEGYGVFQWVPFYCPTGVDRVRVIGWTSSFNSITSYRATIHDALQVTIGGPQTANSFTLFNQDFSGAFGMHFDDGDGNGIPTTPGQVNILKLEAWDGQNDAQGKPIPQDRDFLTWAIVPWAENDPPSVFAERVEFPRTDQTVVTPTKFYGIDESLVGIDGDSRSWNSHVLTKSIKNDALNFELINGIPAGYNEVGHTNVTSRPGHNHKGEDYTGPATAGDNAGIDVDTNLASWSYGVARADVNLSVSRWRVDEVGGVPSWSGRIHGAGINASTAAGAFQTIAQHRVRVPASIDDNTLRVAEGGPDDVTKLKVAFWAVFDEGKTNGIEVRVIVRTAVGGGGTTPLVAIHALGGGVIRELITIDNVGLELTTGDGGVIQTIETAYANSKINRINESLIYGACFYYEA